MTDFIKPADDVINAPEPDFDATERVTEAYAVQNWYNGGTIYKPRYYWNTLCTYPDNEQAVTALCRRVEGHTPNKFNTRYYRVAFVRTTVVSSTLHAFGIADLED